MSISRTKIIVRKSVLRLNYPVLLWNCLNILEYLYYQQWKHFSGIYLLESTTCNENCDKHKIYINTVRHQIFCHCWEWSTYHKKKIDSAIKLRINVRWWQIKSFQFIFGSYGLSISHIFCILQAVRLRKLIAYR